MQGKPIAEQEIGKQLLMETVAYAESNSCRRKLLLSYFGEDYNIENCGACDNCLHPKKQFDGREEMAMVIELIESLPERFKMEHLANILTGEMNSIIKSYHHDKLELFGAGKDRSVRFWNAVMHQGLILKLLHKDIESYGLISASKEGLEFMENPYELKLTEDREFADGDDDDVAGRDGTHRQVGGEGHRVRECQKIVAALSLKPLHMSGGCAAVQGYGMSFTGGQIPSDEGTPTATANNGNIHIFLRFLFS